MALHLSYKDNDKLHVNLLELEASGDPRASADAVRECVTRALAAPLTSRAKLLLSRRGLQFAEEYSSSIQRSDFTLKTSSDHRLSFTLRVSVLCSVLTVYEEHQKLLGELRGTKREAENG